MRFQWALLLGLAASTQAAPAPVPGLIGDLFAGLQASASGIVTTVTSQVKFTSSLAAAVAKLGVTLRVDGDKAGSKFGSNQFVFNELATLKKFIHDIIWAKQGRGFVNWKTYKANGVNLGAWLEQEQNYDVDWWTANVGNNYLDEWTWCEAVGFATCGPKLEARYKSFITKADIDRMFKLGVNTLRIPTTYAAWVKVPGSQLYSGRQQAALSKIVNYAIDKYNMHIILGLHSLPGGVNTLNIGEAFGRNAWFFNATNLDYSFRAVDSVLNFIKASNRQYAFTFAPINEPSDNFAGFATPAGLTVNGTNWINTYMNGVLSRIAQVDKRIPLMLQDAFFSEQYWSPFYPADTNLVIDSHIYFFAAAGAYSQYIAPAICGQAKFIGEGDGKFPVFIGEWSLQSLFNNTLAYRKTLYDTQVYAYSKYASGGAFWNYKMLNNVDPVDGEGKLEDYWSWSRIADAGIISANGVTASYC